MELHQLRYVVAVAKEGNFSRAAETCFVAQPSLSQQILKLEEELGERLFDRMKRAVKLTVHGEAFLLRARRILDEVEAAKKEVTDAKALLSGKVVVGALPTIAPYMLPKALASFARKFPGVEMVVQEDTTAKLVKQLLACEIDFILASHPIRDVRLEVQELFSEELLLAVPRSHRLAKQRTIAAEDLGGERLIVMQEGHCLGEQVLGFCERRDVQPKISFRSAQLETIQALVKAGVGLSLVPAMTARTRRESGVAYRSFQQPRPERRLVTAWMTHRFPGRAAREFLDEVTRLWKADRGQGE